MTIHDESDTENILLRNKMHQQIHKGRKPFIKFLKIFLAYWKMVFQYAGHHLIEHDPVSKRRKQRH